MSLWTRARSVAAGYAGLPYGDPPGLNCSTLYASILQGLYPQELAHVWASLVVADPARPWSDVEVLVGLGLGTWASAPPTVEWVYACQRWTSTDPLGHGHAWLACLRQGQRWERIDANRRDHGALRVGAVTWGEQTCGAETRCVRLTPPRRT